jgi:putative PIN family toxin of toxin-antitoxin system
MKIVIDANIFISAFFWKGNPRKILERAIEGFDKLYISEEIIQEIERVMAYPKFNIDKSGIDYYIKSIEEFAIKIIPDKLGKIGSRDVTDNKYLECGIAGKVDFIISGDIHLLELKEFENIKIMKAKEYLDIM